MNPNDIPTSPHVICFRSWDGRLKPVLAHAGFGLDETFAIYESRHRANRAIKYFTDEFVDNPLFTVPSFVLFDTVEVVKEVFQIRG